MDEYAEFSLSFRLFQRPSFIEGIGRILDAESALNSYNRNVSSEQADAQATAADWCMVGNDINKAMQNVE
ncbi:MAG: hypothetical protein LBT97_03865 [Planctomycetota bacterium]|nr:hypothetical protein [Planctomycetota bacterium]